MQDGLNLIVFATETLVTTEGGLRERLQRAGEELAVALKHKDEWPQVLRTRATLLHKEIGLLVGLDDEEARKLARGFIGLVSAALKHLQALGNEDEPKEGFRPQRTIRPTDRLGQE